MLLNTTKGKLHLQAEPAAPDSTHTDRGARLFLERVAQFGERLVGLLGHDVGQHLQVFVLQLGNCSATMRTQSDGTGGAAQAKQFVKVAFVD